MTKDFEYSQAIEQAKSRMGDTTVRGDAAVGSDALSFVDSLLTPEEISESNLRVAIIGELIKARQEQGISQKKLEELSGVKQPVIARMEKGVTDPRLDTVMKLLLPLGKTLAVVSLDNHEQPA